MPFSLFDNPPLDRIGLIANGKSYSYRTIITLIKKAATALLNKGVDPNNPQPVFLTGHDNVETIITWYALWELGVPAAWVAHKLTLPERQKIQQTNPHWLVIDTPLSFIDETPFEDFPSFIDHNVCGVIVYTSSTTGDPKGVMLSRQNCHYSAKNSLANIKSFDNDRWVCAVPLGHISGLSIVIRTMFAKTCIILSDFANIIATINHHQGTLTSAVPSMIYPFLDIPKPPTLRAILFGGAPCEKKLLDQAKHLPLVPVYGMTETCSHVIAHEYPTPYDPSLGSGKAFKGTEVKIKNNLIYLRGPSVMLGYTAPHPSPIDDDGWFSTNDLGHIDEQGNLHVQGRAGRSIITSGSNVHPTEVEPVLLNHPAIKEAFLFGVPDEIMGNRLAVAMVLSDQTQTLHTFHQHIKNNLTSYKQPRLFCALKRFPKTPVGKVRERELKEQAISRLTPWDNFYKGLS